MPSDTYHRGKYYVTFKRGFEDFKKDITITIDKIFDRDSCLRILLSDDEDPYFLCSLNVSRCDYEDLKKQQGLLIDFDNFPAQLVRLLQQCATNNMFLIMQQTNPAQYYFEIVEHNEFRRLVHLSLKTGPASDNDIKKHMAENIVQLKKTLSTVKTSLSSSEALWNDKCINMERKIHDLTIVVSKMEEDKFRKETEYQDMLRHEKEKFAQELQKCQRSSETNLKTQIANIQETVTRKDKQIDDLNSHIKQLKDAIGQLENQISDKTQRLNVLEKELQKSHIDVATAKAKCTTLERDVLDKDRQCQILNNKCCDLEKMQRENHDALTELRTTLQAVRREKVTLEERLAISEGLANKNNDAAHTTSEQLMKANQIISKQNSDLIEIKEKLLCRTAIALEQEKVIEKNTKQIEDLNTELQTAKQDLDKVKTDLEGLKEKWESNEKSLKDKEEIIKNNNLVIDWLHKKLEDRCENEGIGRKVAGAASSTPYFFQSKNNSEDSQGHSDESINFYATSKLSHLDESSQVVGAERRGLDPKYLAPSTDENKARTGRSTDRKGAEKPTSSQRGKENANVNLPKVDYREKKQAKGSAKSTYRSTPVSAYFH